MIIFEDQNDTILVNMMRYPLPEFLSFPSDEWLNNSVRRNFKNKDKIKHIYIKTKKYILGSLLYAVLLKKLILLYWES